MIDLYTAATPNGWKVSIMLEECGLEYRTHVLELGELDQKKPDFLAINPNGRIPAIVDGDNGGFAVFESGAILVYLAEKAGKFLPREAKARSSAMQWLFWQNAGLGPMVGQLTVFRRYFHEQLPSAIERYERESYRLYGVLEGQLANNRFIGGKDYSIADISCWPWIHAHFWAGLSLESFPNLQRWHDEVKSRPAVGRGVNVPPPRGMDQHDKLIAVARKMLA